MNQLVQCASATTVFPEVALCHTLTEPKPGAYQIVVVSALALFSKSAASADAVDVFTALRTVKPMGSTSKPTTPWNVPLGVWSESRRRPDTR